MARPSIITPIILRECRRLTARQIADKHGFRLTTVWAVLAKHAPQKRKYNSNAKRKHPDAVKDRDQRGQYFQHTYETALI